MVDEKIGFQVVEVLTECRLRDAEAQEQVYWRRDGSCLAPGFYVVHWPAGASAGHFNEEAQFEGPFRQRDGAEAAAPRIMALVGGEDPTDPWRRTFDETIQVVDDRVPLRRRRPT